MMTNRRSGERKLAGINNVILAKNNSDGQSAESENAGVQPKGEIGSNRNAQIAKELGGNRQTDSGALRGSRANKSEQESQLKQYAEDKDGNIYVIDTQIEEKADK